MFKTNIKYKLLAIVPLFGFITNGCTTAQKKENQNNIDNKNVIVDIKDNHMCVRDAKTKEARVVYFAKLDPNFPQEIIDANIQNLEFSRVGDTVELNAPYYNTQYAFRFPPIDMSEIVLIKFNQDSILARKAQYQTKTR